MQAARNLFVSILILFLLTISIQAQEIMSLDEINMGMEGIAKTVFKGTEVEEFFIEIIDILKDRGLDKDFILIKASGEKIEKIGGIAAGMSGSPVYIDDKIIGAIGYGWQYADNRYALVTPIEDMLELIKSAENESAENEEFSSLETPIYISGMSGRAMDNVKEELSDYNLKFLPGNNIQDNKKIINNLKPGSAIAVQLARGDINIASIGTLTYIDGNELLAFGHPFTNKGKVSYLLSPAYIADIIPSDVQAFKLGSPMEEIVGIIDNDRGAGIAGKFNNYPKIIPLNLIITDKDRKISTDVNVQLVKDEDFLTILGTNIALQAIDSTLDRIGKGTASVKMKIMASNVDEYEISFSNIYYSRSDIASRSLSDFYYLLYLLSYNPFKKINIVDLNMEIELEDTDNIALIQEAKILNEELRPGDELELEIKLHPYRQEIIVKKMKIKIPEEFEPGYTSIVIDGGFSGVSQLPAKIEDIESSNYEETKQAEIETYKDFDAMIKDYLERPRNNELIVHIYPAYSMPQAEETELEQNDEQEDMLKKDEPSEKEDLIDKNKNKESKDELDTEESAEEINEKLSTDYVLEGSLTLELNIVAPETEEEGL